MTNPDNAVGTNGAFGGRTSVNAFNDVLSSYASRGVISGWGIVPSSGMTLSIGGDGTDRDVAIAADATNNKTTVNNISEVPIEVTLDSAPASNSRYDAIVVYVDKPPISNATQDNPECCGIIPVSGLAASTPAYPDDATIRSAITADGASGATAYYAILGYVLVAAGTTAITSAMITMVPAPSLNATVDGSNLVDNSVTSDKIDYAIYSNSNTVYTKSGRVITGSVYIDSRTDISIPKFDSSPYNAGAVSFAPPESVFFPVWARNSANAPVSNLFGEINRSGAVRLRNLTSTDVTVRNIRSNFSYIIS